MQRERRKFTVTVRFDYVTFATLGKWLEWKGIKAETRSDVVHEATEALVALMVEKGVVPVLTSEQAIAWLNEKGMMPVPGQRGHASIVQHAAKTALLEDLGVDTEKLAKVERDIISAEKMEEIKQNLKHSLAGGRNKAPGALAGPAPKKS